MKEKTNQQLTHERNWQILQLRGIYTTIRKLEIHEDYQAAILVLIDHLLLQVGAEKEGKRRKRLLEIREAGE